MKFIHRDNFNVTWSTDLKEQIEGLLLILGKVDAKPLDVNDGGMIFVGFVPDNNVLRTYQPAKLTASPII